jgi:chemotaxis protein CheD
MSAPKAAAPGGPQWTYVFLMPGALYCAPTPTIITTILGSCISVCLWDRARRIGGMNHFVLPEASDNPSARYGDVSIEQLISGMLLLGSRIGDLVAKLFGGATVLPIGGLAETVGARNLDMALNTLRHRHVKLAAHRTGGGSGQMVKFNTYTGEVVVRKLAAASTN